MVCSWFEGQLTMAIRDKVGCCLGQFQGKFTVAIKQPGRF